MSGAKVDISDAMRAFDKLSKSGVDKISSAVLSAGGDILFKETRAAISRRDFSLQQLRDMGHPYARAGGATPRVHGGKPLIHTQSGRLLASLTGKMEGKRSYRWGFDEAKAPHAPMVILGTRVMLPRDVFRMVYNDKEKSKNVISRMQKSLIRAVTKMNS